MAFLLDFSAPKFMQFCEKLKKYGVFSNHIRISEYLNKLSDPIFIDYTRVDKDYITLFCRGTGDVGGFPICVMIANAEPLAAARIATTAMTRKNNYIDAYKVIFSNFIYNPPPLSEFAKI